MARKSFFRNRTPEEIQASLKIKRVFTQRGLVDKIWNLDTSQEAIELRTPIIPSRFLFRADNSAQASRRDYKHGDLITINQPESRKEAHDYPYIPLESRMMALDESFRGKREEEINSIGIT